MSVREDGYRLGARRPRFYYDICPLLALKSCATPLSFLSLWVFVPKGDNIDLVLTVSWSRYEHCMR